MAGPLHGIKVVEMAGIGPAPFCGMMLADMGAEVVRIDRLPRNKKRDVRFDVLGRGRRVMALDLKHDDGKHVALELIAHADALLEGFRPGVMERLGLGPDECLARNPKLVYGRMTGWGQTGPLAHTAGHDLNYIALSGMLHAIGRTNAPPPPPLNLIGDFGGGGMLLAFGMVCALLEAKHSGRGQVIDAAMTDGSALLGALMFGMKAAGRWTVSREKNLLDGGAHFYDTYECADGKYLAIGAIEPQFYAELVTRLGITDESFRAQLNAQEWPTLKQKLAAHIKTKTRAEWSKLFEGTDACVTPVLDMDEAIAHPHHVSRGAFVELDGVTQPAPAPRFSRTAAVANGAQRDVDAAVLRDWGFGEERIARLKADAVIE